ncbi:Phosphate ABC transporter, periplasmic phosphate-binding protein PstS [Clostridiaceae bacterium JG1575]|nr:Phosphate ABC transporter, periplasmic phosphate-binding protein PstS [Clostridiaceae bacterium JG1575]
MKKTLKAFIASLLVSSVMLAGCGGTPKTTTGAAGPNTDSPTTGGATTPAASQPGSNDQGSKPASGPIHVYTRDATSGTREAFEHGIGFKKDQNKLTASAVETSGNGDMASKVGKDKSAIGYVSLTTDFSANNLKPVSFEGVEPSVKTVLDDSYTLKRPFSFVTRAKGDFASPEAEALTAAFVAFLTQSNEGHAAVEGAGGILDKSEGKPWAEVMKNVQGFDPTKDYSNVTLRTRGSTSVDKTIKAALEAFQAQVAFKFNMDQTGSGDGFKRVLGAEKTGPNAGDIGFASRKFDPAKEPVDQGMIQGIYCQDAVVVVVESSNALKNITAEKMLKIVDGDITKWEDLK